MKNKLYNGGVMAGEIPGPNDASQENGSKEEAFAQQIADLTGADVVSTPMNGLLQVDGEPVTAAPAPPVNEIPL